MPLLANDVQSFVEGGQITFDSHRPIQLSDDAWLYILDRRRFNRVMNARAEEERLRNEVLPDFQRKVGERAKGYRQTGNQLWCDEKGYVELAEHADGEGRESGVGLVAIYVIDKYRRQGVATKLLSDVCAVADNESLTLYASVAPFERKQEPYAPTKIVPPSTDTAYMKEHDIYKWLAKHGFMASPCQRLMRPPGKG